MPLVQIVIRLNSAFNIMFGEPEGKLALILWTFWSDNVLLAGVYCMSLLVITSEADHICIQMTRGPELHRMFDKQ